MESGSSIKDFVFFSPKINRRPLKNFNPGSNTVRFAFRNTTLTIVETMDGLGE